MTHRHPEFTGSIVLTPEVAVEAADNYPTSVSLHLGDTFSVLMPTWRGDGAVIRVLCAIRREVDALLESARAREAASMVDPERDGPVAAISESELRGKWGDR